MSVAVYHAGMQPQSGTSSAKSSPLPLVVTSSTPSDVGGIVVCHATRISGGVYAPFQVL